MEYKDFELSIRGRPEHYTVSVEKSPGGETVRDSAFVLPAGAADLVRQFDAARHAAAAHPAVIDQTRAVEPLSNADGTAGDASPSSIGQTLFDGVFTAPVSRLYAASLALVGLDKGGLRVKLRIDAPELRTLPWEYLFDSVKEDFVALQPRLSITRFVNVAEPPQSPIKKPPLRILIMVASPIDKPTLDAESECRELVKAVDDRIANHRIELGLVDGQTLEDLKQTLKGSKAALRREPGASEKPEASDKRLDGPWHIFHFIGHGGTKEGKGIVALCNSDKTTHPVPAEDLAEVLDSHASMRLVVLNCCKGATGDSTDRFSSTSELILKTGISAVVAMQTEITDPAAKRFAASLYDRLSEEDTLEEALLLARKAVKSRMTDPLAAWEWGTPVLSMRSDDGRLFEFSLGDSVFPSDSGVAPAPSDPSPAPPAVPPPVPPPAPVLPPTVPQKSLRASVFGTKTRPPLNLRDVVRDGWIKRKLELDLMDEIPIDIMMEVLVAGSGDEATDDGAPPPSIVKMQAIRSTFRDAGQSLVVLGEPATGKTVAMLLLLRELLAESTKDLTRPVPVPFTLDTWANDRRPLGDWMVTQLCEKFSQTKVDAESLVLKGSRRIIPCLDGLDEVPEDARPACVEAINTYCADASVAGVVVTSRFDEYVALPEKLTPRAAVAIQRLQPDAVLEHVAAAGPSFAALDTILRGASELLLNACAPLLLRLLMRAVRDGSVKTVEQLAANFAETTPERRKNVIDAWVAGQFAKAGA